MESLYKVPHRRIDKVPEFLRPLVLWLKSIIVHQKLSESEMEVNRKLAFGVEYAFGADVEGDIAEFGTMTGRTARVISETLSKFDSNSGAKKKIHLFDSFMGLPEAESNIDIDSPHVKSGVWSMGTCRGVSKSELRNMCEKFLSADRVVIYDGWFKDTLRAISPETKYSMVHIDSDLYQSAIEVLSYLFEKRVIQDGTVLFFDDYNCNGSSPDFGERKAWEETIKRFSVHYTDCGEYGWAGRKFIVHSYD